MGCIYRQGVQKTCAAMMSGRRRRRADGVQVDAIHGRSMPDDPLHAASNDRSWGTTITSCAYLPCLALPCTTPTTTQSSGLTFWTAAQVSATDGLSQQGRGTEGMRPRLECMPCNGVNKARAGSNGRAERTFASTRGCRLYTVQICRRASTSKGLQDSTAARAISRSLRVIQRTKYCAEAQ